MQPLTVLRLEGLDGGCGKLHLGLAKGADGADRREAVAAVRPFHRDEPFLHVGGRGLDGRRQPLARELRPAKAADGLDQLRRRRVVRAAVEGVDALVVPEADLRQHRPRAHALGTDFADGLLDLLREDGRVDLPRGEELLDEFLVLPREPIRVLVGESGELAPERLPERAPPVFLQPGKKLDQDAVAKARPVHGDVEETHVAELLAGLALAAELRVDHQAADLGRTIEVVADGEHAMAEVTVDARRIVLLLVDVEENVRRVPGAVLRDEQGRTHHLSGSGVLHHEQVFALEGVADAAVEGAGGSLQDRAELALVVGEVDGVQLGGELAQAGQIALLAVADHVQAHSSTRRDSYRSHAFSSCAISMRSFGVCAFPVLRPGPMTIASQPARANTPASVLVGFARGRGSRPCRDSAAPVARISGASSGSDIPEALRSTDSDSSSPPWPSCSTQVCAWAENCPISESGSCVGSTLASSWRTTASSPLSSTLSPPTAPAGSNRASLPDGRLRCHSSSRADAVASARQRFGCGARGGRKRVAAGSG